MEDNKTKTSASKHNPALEIAPLNNVHADKSDEFNFGNGIVGLAQESAELLGLWKLETFDERDIDDVTYIDEIADVVWFLGLVLQSKGWSLEMVKEFSRQKTALRAEFGKDKPAEKVHFEQFLENYNQGR